MNSRNMNFDVDEIDTSKLNLSGGYDLVSMLVKSQLDDGKITDDLTLSWIINSPPIFAAQETDEFEAFKRRFLENYLKNKDSSIQVVQLLKREFYDFMCTDSDYYEKERSSLGENINLMITGISSAIATNLSSIEIGIITSFVTIFMLIVGKMGKRALCEAFKPVE